MVALVPPTLIPYHCLLMKKALLLFFFFCHMAAHAQSDSLRAEQQVWAAQRFLKNNQPDSASAYHQKALQGFRKLDLPYRAVRSYYTVYYTELLKQEKPVQLLDSLEAGLGHCRRQPKTRSESSFFCNYLLQIGSLYQRKLKDYQSARHYYEQAYTVFIEKLGENDDVNAKTLYHQLANTYTRLGDYGRAKILLKRKLAYGVAHQMPEMQGALSDLAIVYFEEGHLDSAKLMLERELALPDNSDESKFTLLNTVASYYLKKQAVGQADSILHISAQYLEALQKEKTWQEYLKLEADWYSMMGKTSSASSLQDTAFAFYQKSINDYLKSMDGELQGRELGKIYIETSVLLLKMNRPAEAVNAVQLALRCVLPAFLPIGDENPDAADFYPENTILEALLQKAATLEKMGRYDEALACYELIPAAEAKLRETYQYEASSLILAAESRSWIERVIGIARLLYDRTGDAHYSAKAFYFSELARGGVLLDGLAATAAATALPATWRREEQELRSRVAWYEQEISEAKKGESGQSLEALEAALFQLKQKNATQQAALKKEYPQYAALRSGIDLAAVGDVPAMLQPGQALASFLLTDSLLHVFFFAPGNSGQMAWRTDTLPPGFFLETSSLVDYLSSENKLPAAKDKFAEGAHSLYRLLLGPELDALDGAVSSLVVVPDGALSFLPFEILLEKPATVGRGFGEMAFLVKKMAVSSLSSITLAKWQAEKGGHGQAPEPFAGFAPHYGDGKDALASTRGGQDSLLLELVRGGLYDLPGAREEVRQVNSIIGGESYVGELARKAAFLENAHRYRILHLAMHALPDRKNPALGRFIFTQRPGDTERDFTLYANELGNLSLEADLAVLSACNTGNGTLRRGEGVYSLARSFMLAGVSSVVMSLWRLPDGATAEIMVGFYKEMKGGKGKAEALRLTKLAYLKAHQSEPEHLHPFYWAGLTLAGQ